MHPGRDSWFTVCLELNSSRSGIVLFSARVTIWRTTGVADEWVTQLLRQGDSQVFKKYSQMKLAMKREAMEKLNRLANEMTVGEAQSVPVAGFWNSFGTAGSRTVGVMTPLHLHLGRTKSESAAWIFARSRTRFTFLDRDLLFQNCLRIDSRCLNLHIVFAFVAGIFPKLVTWFLSMSAYHEGGDLPRSRIH
jgi:hypothetical protein